MLFLNAGFKRFIINIFFTTAYSYVLISWRCWNLIFVTMSHRFTSRDAVSVLDVTFILLAEAGDAYAAEKTIIIMILLLTLYHGHYNFILARLPTIH